MSEHKEPIPSMIYNASIGGHVTNSQQIIDENENKEQSQINAEIKQTLGQGGSVDSRISKAKTDIIGGASSNGNTLKKIEARVSPLESAIGSGGSVDSRIAAAKSEIKGNVTSSCDTLGKAEVKINDNVNFLSIESCNVKKWVDKIVLSDFSSKPDTDLEIEIGIEAIQATENAVNSVWFVA